MRTLFTKTRWKLNREANLEMARRSKEYLSKQYGPNDRRVKEAVTVWVMRARRCHAIVMGRQPVIQNFTYINGNSGTVASGPVFAQ